TFLFENGVTDFDRYRVDPGQDLLPDFFVPDADRPPPGVTLAAKTQLGFSSDRSSPAFSAGGDQGATAGAATGTGALTSAPCKAWRTSFLTSDWMPPKSRFSTQTWIVKDVD